MSFPIEQVRLNSFPVYLFLVTKICNRIDITKQKQQKKSLLYRKLFLCMIECNGWLRKYKQRILAKSWFCMSLQCLQSWQSCPTEYYN